MNNFGWYSMLSVLGSIGAVAHAYILKVQFYPTIVYLVTSKIAVFMLCNLLIVATVEFGKLCKRIFLSELRTAEVELLYENSRYAITETCLALSIFREELGFATGAMFTTLLFAKMFHWLCQSRLEFMEQAENLSRFTYCRIVALLMVLASVDAYFVYKCTMDVVDNGPSVLILFGFEFLILWVTLTAIAIRFCLHIIDLRVEGTWHNKSTYLFYLDLLSEVFKLFIYLIFFMIIFTYYGMPLHIVRDLWMSIKGLQKRIEAYYRYRKVTRNMKTRFPCPTEAELNDTDRTCIICREEMSIEDSKRLPCSHIFHLNCLRMWLQRQQSCPTCRSNIPTKPPREETTPAANPAPNVPNAHQAINPNQNGQPPSVNSTTTPGPTANPQPPHIPPMFGSPFYPSFPYTQFPMGSGPPNSTNDPSMPPSLNPNILQQQIFALQSQLQALQTGQPIAPSIPSSTPPMTAASTENSQHVPSSIAPEAVHSSSASMTAVHDSPTTAREEISISTSAREEIAVSTSASEEINDSLSSVNDSLSSANEKMPAASSHASSIRRRNVPSSEEKTEAEIRRERYARLYGQNESKQNE